MGNGIFKGRLVPVKENGTRDYQGHFLVEHELDVATKNWLILITNV